MLYYRLIKNSLITGNSDGRLARPIDVPVRTFKDLIRDITGPGSILKPTESEAVIGDYWGRIADYLSQGEAYSDDYISIRFSFRGVFKGDEDRFDPERHELIAGIRLKKTVTGAVAEIELRKVDGQTILPEIDHVYDWGSETTDETLTPGDVLEITGEHLKLYDNLEEEEGVFFVSQSGDSEIRAWKIRTNEPKSLTLRIPATLTSGTWRLEVRNTGQGGRTLRRGIFTPVLRVQ